MDKQGMDTKVKTSVRIPVGLHAAIRQTARERGVSSHAVILETLRGAFVRDRDRDRRRSKV